MPQLIESYIGKGKQYTGYKYIIYKYIINKQVIFRDCNWYQR